MQHTMKSISGVHFSALMRREMKSLPIFILTFTMLRKSIHFFQHRTRPVLMTEKKNAIYRIKYYVVHVLTYLTRKDESIKGCNKVMYFPANSLASYHNRIRVKVSGSYSDII